MKFATFALLAWAGLSVQAQAQSLCPNGFGPCSTKIHIRTTNPEQLVSDLKVQWDQITANDPRLRDCVFIAPKFKREFNDSSEFYIRYDFSQYSRQRTLFSDPLPQAECVNVFKTALSAASKENEFSYDISKNDYPSYQAQVKWPSTGQRVLSAVSFGLAGSDPGIHFMNLTETPAVAR